MVDLTPGIKFQPVRYAIAQIGKQLNKEILQEVNNLAKDLESHKIDSWRAEILDFANSCMNRRRHTKEEFDHIISIHDDYAKYLKEKEIENGQVNLAYEYIEALYKKCCVKNDFLSGRMEEEREAE